MGNQTKMSDNCETVEILQAYLKRKAQSHNSYKHYAPIDRIIKIVKEKKLYLGDGKDWNDTVDSDNFTNSRTKLINFGKCFSYAQDESVAMWMLYGGTYHNNAMIDFTRTAIRNILNTSTIKLGFWQNGEFVCVSEIKKLDFCIEMVDVVYYNKKTKYLKRSDESCINVSDTLIDQLGLYGKAYPWSYENECRLIVSIKKEMIPEGCNTVEIDLEGIDLGKSLERTYYCPNFEGEKTNNFQKSKLDGYINFKLIN